MVLLAGASLLMLPLVAVYHSALSAYRIEERASRMQYAGINIAGCEFGIQVDVVCSA